MIVALAGDNVQGKPSPAPRLQVLSAVELKHQVAYDGPTWLDQAILSKWRPDPQRGFATDLRRALADRSRWLADCQLADLSPVGEVAPKPDMMRNLRRAETERLVRDLSGHFKSTFIPAEPGRRISGVYERAIMTPTGKLAVIRRQDTFTLAPWKPALEPMRGRTVTGLIGPRRVMWTLDRGRTLPGRG
jgi:hypothetical protein